MPSFRSRFTIFRLALRRAILLRRRWLAALLTGVAVAAGLQATSAPEAPSDVVVTAAHDLGSGTVLRAVDLVAVSFADGTAPAGASSVAEAVGRTLASPLRRGEAVTDVRLVGPGLLETHAEPDLVAVPVRIPDPEVVALLRVGDRISLLSTDPRGRGTETVAADVLVLALPRAPDAGAGLSSGAGLGGRLVVIGLSSELSEIVADAAVQGFLSVALTR